MYGTIAETGGSAACNPLDVASLVLTVSVFGVLLCLCRLAAGSRVVSAAATAARASAVDWHNAWSTDIIRLPSPHVSAGHSIAPCPPLQRQSRYTSAAVRRDTNNVLHALDLNLSAYLAQLVRRLSASPRVPMGGRQLLRQHTPRAVCSLGWRLPTPRLQLGR